MSYQEAVCDFRHVQVDAQADRNDVGEQDDELRQMIVPFAAETLRDGTPF